MKVLVIGAGGKSGEALVKEALAQGHQVAAFVHSASEYKAPAGVTVIEGDVLDAAKIDAAVSGHDAVLDALGGKTPYKETTLETSAARNVVNAMRAHGARRLIAISVLGVGESVEHAGFFYEHIFMPTFLRGAMKDKAGMESAIEGSNLDWVLVRPPVLTEGEKTGNVRVLPPSTEEKAHKISRADLAAFMVAQLSSDEYLHQAVVVATE